MPVRNSNRRLEVLASVKCVANLDQDLAKTHRTATRARVTWKRAPARWKRPCAHTECSLHQLSPYIGKIKSTIAGELIDRYTSPRDLVADPFSGAGTIPFEAVLRGRRAFG